MKYCIVTLNWDSLVIHVFISFNLKSIFHNIIHWNYNNIVVMLSIGWLCGARYSISGYIVGY